MQTSQETAGFIGLGLMGHGMAKNLVDKGYTLSIYARKPSEATADLQQRGALLRAFAATAGLTLATSHSAELKALKYGDTYADGALNPPESALFENAAAEFDDVALAPTYRLLWGVPGRSRALDIAARLGLIAR